MTTMTKTTSRPIVSLNLPNKVPDLIAYTNNVVQKMTNNPAFPGTITALALVQTALAGLQTAETAALNRGKGAATERNEKRTALIAALQQLRAFVQGAADGGGANAASIIQGAGFDVRKTPTRHARVFGAKQGPVSGVATVVAPSAGPRASYEWQSSTDGGKTWVTMPPTMQAKTSVTGLAAGTSVELKYRTVTKDGPGDWSVVVTFVVQ
jgi:hypothetical protein